MASPPLMSLLKVPGGGLIFGAPEVPPDYRLILAISAAETVLSTVTTRRFAFASTAQAVPGTSERRIESAAWLSWVALYVVASPAWAAGMASAAAATRPEERAIMRVRLVTPLRGVVRVILTGS